MSRPLLKASFFLTLAESLALPTALVTTGYLTRQLGASGYGQFALAAAVINWIQWSLMAIFFRATVTILGLSADWRAIAASTLRLQATIAASLMTVVLLTAPLIAAALHTPSLTGTLRLYSFEILFFGSAAAYRAINYSQGDYRLRALSAAARWLTRLLFIVTFVLLGFGLHGAIVGSVLAAAIELLVAMLGTGVRWADLRRAPWFPPGFLSIAGPFAVAVVATRLYERVDLFLLRSLGGTDAQCGFYGAAQTLSLAASVISLSISPLVLASILKHVREGDREPARRIGFQALRGACWLIPIAAVAAAVADHVVPLLFSAQFSESGPILRILVFSGVLGVLTAMVSAVLNGFGRLHVNYLVAWPQLIAAVIIGWLIIPHYFAIGAAAMNLGTTVAALIALLILAERTQPGVVPWLSLVRSLGATAIVLILGLWWHTGSWIWVMKAVALTGLVGLLALAMREIQPDDFAEFAHWWHARRTRHTSAPID